MKGLWFKPPVAERELWKGVWRCLSAASCVALWTCAMSCVWWAGQMTRAERCCTGGKSQTPALISTQQSSVFSGHGLWPLAQQPFLKGLTQSHGEQGSAAERVCIVHYCYWLGHSKVGIILNHDEVFIYHTNVHLSEKSAPLAISGFLCNAPINAPISWLPGNPCSDRVRTKQLECPEVTQEEAFREQGAEHWLGPRLMSKETLCQGLVLA